MKTLLSISRFSNAAGSRGKGSAGIRGLSHGLLTPQSSDVDSEDEKESTMMTGPITIRDVDTPMDLALTKKQLACAYQKKLAQQRQQQEQEKKQSQSAPRASVIMLAHSDGTFEPAKLSGENAKKEVEQRHGAESAKELPPAEDLPSRKTSGSEMTSGHRDKNIPLSGGVVAMSGDDLSGSHIAASTRAPVFVSGSPNLPNVASKFLKIFI